MGISKNVVIAITAALVAQTIWNNVFDSLYGFLDKKQDVGNLQGDRLKDDDNGNPRYIDIELVEVKKTINDGHEQELKNIQERHRQNMAKLNKSAEDINKKHKQRIDELDAIEREVDALLETITPENEFQVMKICTEKISNLSSIAN